MVRVFTLLCLAALLGPFDVEAKPKKKTDEPMGPRVMAPWGRMGKRYPGIVIARYGKFVEVKFDDGYSGWCSGDLTNPPVEALPQPNDPNPWKAGDKVQAKWSLKGFLRAVVIDTYGSLTLVHFDSDDRAWIRAAEVKAR